MRICASASHRHAITGLLLSAMAFALAAAAAPARAGDQPHPTLDAAASEVAGRPVTVRCENSQTEWTATVAAIPGSPPRAGGYVHGVDSSVAYLAPSECLPLHHALSTGYKRAGIYPLTSALLTLAHEAVHLRGIADEGVAECTALPLVPELAVKYFGVPRTVTRTSRRILKKWVHRDVRGKRTRVRVSVTVRTSSEIPNPDLAVIQETALELHRGRAAEYQGDC
jgi:hypothetical protein